ncbi:Swi3-domain-containing protein [Melanomma pulvis-pyrius CBS 109.77]|uniref:Chromosome segregation in meiosis protein n=1 Tax=Melanomma pulvis-pyrius CBS 109.77 TaxID=1314802 RepID=A0A6A6WYH9_9PLEO|nr:Swi3-domain-containing protein [Melanomma pulvis-pyrius CBS 109.77]
MAPTNPAARDITSDDELDAILNGELDIRDISATVDNHTQKQQTSAATTAALGLDNEVEVEKVKKRQPIPKLDDARLLSAAGIPKLRRISKERLRFKGKGHEYGDIARMLNMYQLWLDDLYPRAKFADGLAMIEKLGHTKHIQYMRKEWIAEGKPKHAMESDPEDDIGAVPDNTVEQNTERIEGVEVEDASLENEQQRGEPGNTPQQIENTARAPEDDPDEDELDALLAENDALNASLTATALRPKITAPEEELFEDDMEAMAEMDDMW